MRAIVERFRGRTTGSGHDIRVDETPGVAVVWYLFWGEYQGVDDHHHMGIARVSWRENAYFVGWLQGTEQEASDESVFNTVEEMLSALDQEISRR